MLLSSADIFINLLLILSKSWIIKFSQILLWNFKAQTGKVKKIQLINLGWLNFHFLNDFICINPPCSVKTMIIAVVFKLRWTSESPRELDKTQISGLHPCLSDYEVGLGWAPRICISNKLSSVADAVGPGTKFEKHSFIYIDQRLLNLMLSINLDAPIDWLWNTTTNWNITESANQLSSSNKNYIKILEENIANSEYIYLRIIK